MPTSQKSKTSTFIKWTPVDSELPKNGVKVLALEDDSEDPIVAVFYHNSGWKLQTLSSKVFKNAVEQKTIVVIKFWSYFNLPK